MVELKQKQDCQVIDLGLVEYKKAYDFQKECVQKVLNDHDPILILCEHPAVLTLGRLADERHLLTPRDELQKQGIDVEFIDRGGEVTLHSPGQLVVYPIVNLNNFDKDLHRYLHFLEEVAIDLLGKFDIVASRSSVNTGAWVGPDKIVSVGIGVRKWISYHGMAINVNTNLNLFSLINPCGLDVKMTSMAKIKGQPVNMAEVKEQVINIVEATRRVART